MTTEPNDGWSAWRPAGADLKYNFPSGLGQADLVEIRRRNGESDWGTASSFCWRHNGVYPVVDIVAYRRAAPECGACLTAHAPDAPCPAAAALWKPTTAPDLLQRAAGHMQDRAAQYDQPTGERSMGRAVAALNAVLGRQALTESEGWLLLQLLKDVRDRQRPAPHADSLEDGIAYAALKAEARLQEKAHG